MTKAELIKELRYCAEHDGCDYYVAKDCPREDTWVCGADCDHILMRAAADAIETLSNPKVAVVPKFDGNSFLVQAIILYSDGTSVASEFARLSIPMVDDTWTRVEDGLPEEKDEWGQGVYVLATDGIVMTRAFYGYPGGHDEWFINAGEQWEATFGRPVTHWMPLPKLPNAETKGEKHERSTAD